jgi:AcrR family transcriptional regulator
MINKEALAHNARSTNPPPFARKGYHHGHLREALIAATERLIISHGAANFSVSDAARMVGVSAAAPYRHFPDRNALMAEMARRAMEKLKTRLFAAPENEGLRGLATAFIRFAQDEPAYYQALYHSGLPLGSNPNIGEDGYMFLLERLKKWHGLTGECAVKAALLIVALGHGLAGMTQPTDLSYPSDAPTPLDLLLAGVNLVISGLEADQKAAP